MNVDPNEQLQVAIDEILNAFPRAVAVYRFGSFGTQYQRKESDLDLAILISESVDSLKLWNLAQGIASKINTDVEIINLFDASTVFRHQIVTTGTRVYCSDTKKADSVENNYISMYLRLNEERADILKDYTGSRDGRCNHE